MNPGASRFSTLLDHPAVRVLREAARGGECLLVGGTLRDHALGRPYHDLDAVVAGGVGRGVAERVAAALPARLVLLGGKEFAAFRLVGQEVEIDLWDREEMTRQDDLARRDLTINAIALDVHAGELIDPFGGLVDLDRRVLRAVTGDSFRGDPLRVLRLPRLSVQLSGFTIEPATAALARQAAPHLTEVAAERIRDELGKIFAHPEAARGLAVLAATGVYPELWLAGAVVDQGAAQRAIPEMEALAGAAAVFAEFAPDLPESPEGAAAARLAVTFAALPEPVATLDRFCAMGYLPRRAASDVAVLLGARADLAAPPDDERGRRRLLHRLGSSLWRHGIAFLGVRTRGEVAPFVDLVSSEGEGLFTPPRLLSGTEVQELLGLAPGPAVGRALAALTAAQVDGTVRTREEALARLAGEAFQAEASEHG